eukprot:1144241-Pelagomonas_calceolata.AAC.1
MQVEGHGPAPRVARTCAQFGAGARCAGVQKWSCEKLAITTCNSLHPRAKAQTQYTTMVSIPGCFHGLGKASCPPLCAYALYPMQPGLDNRCWVHPAFQSSTMQAACSLLLSAAAPCGLPAASGSAAPQDSSGALLEWRGEEAVVWAVDGVKELDEGPAAGDGSVGWGWVDVMGSWSGDG